MSIYGQIRYFEIEIFTNLVFFNNWKQCIFNIASICNSYMGSILEILILTGVHAYQNLQKRSHFRTSRKERKKKRFIMNKKIGFL